MNASSSFRASVPMRLIIDAPLAEDDPLLRFALHEDGAVDPQKLVPFSAPRTGRHHAVAYGSSRACAAAPSRGRSRRRRTLGLIGQVVGRIERLALGQVIEEQRSSRSTFRRSRPRPGRSRRRSRTPLIPLRSSAAACLLDQIDLVEHQEAGARVLDQIEHELVALARAPRSRRRPAPARRPRASVERGVHHPHVHPVQRPWMPGVSRNTICASG